MLSTVTNEANPGRKSLKMCIFTLFLSGMEKLPSVGIVLICSIFPELDWQKFWESPCMPYTRSTLREFGWNFKLLISMKTHTHKKKITVVFWVFKCNPWVSHKTFDEMWFTSPYSDPTRLVVTTTSRQVHCRHLTEAGSSLPLEAAASL